MLLNMLTVHQKTHHKQQTTKPLTGYTTTHNKPNTMIRLHAVKHRNLSNQYTGNICNMGEYYFTEIFLGCAATHTIRPIFSATRLLKAKPR
jgi:hypothetical protein